MGGLKWPVEDSATPTEQLETARFRLLDSITVFLKKVAAAHPLVLIIDDAHVGDPSSLLLLQFLTRELEAAHILVIATCRETRGRGASADFLAAAREGNRIFLHGFNEPEIAQYLAGALAVEIPAALRATVHQVTRGNLLLLDEVVRALEAEVRHSPSSGVDWADTRLAERVTAIIERRRSSLAYSEGSAGRDPRRLGYELGLAFAQRRRVDDLIPFAVATCREALQAEGIAVLLLDRNRQLYFPYIAEADPAVAGRLELVRFSAERGIAGQVLSTGEPVRVDDVSVDPAFFGGVDQCTGRTTRAVICAPLITPRGAIGVIEAVNPCTGVTFSDADLALLDALAQSLAQALHQARRRGPRGIGEREAREPIPTPRAAIPANVFRRDGDYWNIAYADRVVRLKDSRGLQYLVRLLRHAGQEILAIDLVQGAPTGDRGTGIGAQTAAPISGPQSTDPALDAQAKAAYKQRLDELRDELSEAETNNDLGRAERARAEIDMLAAQLRGALGLGGRDRPAGSDLERARSAVGKRIRAEIKRIRSVHPALGRHLAATVTTGYFCAYNPDRDDAVKWEL